MRAIHRLSDRKVKNASEGLHADGGNLLLQVTVGAAGQLNRSWLFRFALHGRERRMGLGSYPDVGLAEAREKAADARKLVAQKVDPIKARDDQRASQEVAGAKPMTFDQCCETYIASHQAAWSPRHAHLWKRSLAMYAAPVFGKIPVTMVNVTLVMQVLEPMWRSVPDVATRVRGRIESVLDWARVRGYRTGENPARWRGHLDHLLPARSRVRMVQHFPALPYTEAGAFMARLRARQGTVARVLEFTVLTACRTGEVLGARWSEIDGKVWTIPALRMKGGREHRVPLSDAVMRIIECQGKVRVNDFIFPGVRRHSLHPRVMQTLVRRMGMSCSVHGFRSTFRDWAAETTDYPNHVVEQALAHSIGNAVEAAYRRGDLFEKRRALMELWSRFCTSAPADTSDNVVLMRASA
jgi:integrase